MASLFLSVATVWHGTAGKFEDHGASQVRIGNAVYVMYP